MRFGLLGTGYWAAHTQGPALAAHPGVELVGVWGRDAGKATALAEQLGARGFADVGELIDAVDAVAVALPPDVQAELALRAAQAGRHLLLDKPLALSVAAADPVVAAVRERGLASTVYFSARFVPAIDEFVHAAASTGGWHGARAVRFSANFVPGGPYAQSVWRRDKGGLWDVGPHVLSVLLPVLGPVVEVTAMTGPRDTSHVLARHAGGAVSTMALSIDAAPEAVANATVFFGERGNADLPPGGSSVDGFGRAVDNLLAAAGGTADAVDPRFAVDVGFARDVVAVLAAAQDSAAQGRTVRV